MFQADQVIFLGGNYWFNTVDEDDSLIVNDGQRRYDDISLLHKKGPSLGYKKVKLLEYKIGGGDDGIFEVVIFS